MRYFISLVLIFIVKGSLAQRAETIQDYIDQFKDLAIKEMKRTGIPASIKLAQGIHETMAGQSPLVIKSNNHFGIKCKTGWNGPSVRHTDDARNECFRKYNSAEESYKDHSNFLKGSSRYAPLFELNPTDYEAWARGLKAAGYATNPFYAQTLIRLIEDYDLQQYSMVALGYETGDDAAEKTVDSKEIEKPVVATGLTATPAPQTSVETAAVTIAKKSVREEEQKTTPPLQKPVENRYPSGVFKEQGYRAIYITAGTPFLVIAQQYNVPLARLFEWNNLVPSTEAASSQVLFLEKKTKSLLRLPSLRSSM
ncbi:MAG: glucosaminidase domain-containing protein [Bacteroidetes bacterium]|nr:glucosaminidase domain-containing protein [Bacteroidota bacterium]